MEGQKFAKTKYMRDSRNSHPRIREDSVDIWLVESPMFLTLKRRSDDRDLEHIAWDSIKNISSGVVDKKGLATLGMYATWAAGGFDSGYHDGVMVDYWDEEYERTLTVFFKTGGRRASDKLIRILWDKRDYYIAMSGRRGDIRR
jgi:hypothetical protein